MAFVNKAGDEVSLAPAVCPSGLSTGRTGPGQVSKFQALFAVLGHSIARFPCGRTVQVTPGALVDISFHSSAFSSGAKQRYA